MITLLQATFFVGGFVLIALVGMVIVRRTVDRATLERHNEVAGFVYAVIGVVYAVILAFVVVVVWEQYNATDQHVHQEAAAIVAVARLTNGLPEPQRGQIQQLLRDYTRGVVEDEWQSLAWGELDRATVDRMHSLYQVFRQVEPRTEREQALYSESLAQLSSFDELRWQRLLDSRENVPAAMWLVLIVGAVLTVAFTYLFGAPDVRVQAVITAALAASIAMLLFLVYSLDFPFRGDVRVSQEPFRYVLLLLDDEFGTTAVGTGGS